MAWLMKADGTTVELVPADGEAFALHELQHYVDGDIQLLWAPGQRALFINEHGKARALPRNERASTLMFKWLAADDYIAGDAVLCSLAEAGC